MECINQASAGRPRLARREACEQVRHTFCPVRVSRPAGKTRFVSCNLAGLVARDDVIVSDDGLTLELGAITLLRRKAIKITDALKKISLARRV